MGNLAPPKSPLTPVMGSSELGHILMSCRGFKAFNASDELIGIFAEAADAVMAILNASREGQACCE